MHNLTIFAYIDPSVMTYAIQAGAGIVIAAGAFVGLYFHKAKKKVSKKLGLDENTKKEVESDDIITTKTPTKSSTSAKSNTSAKSKTSAKSATKSSTKSTTTKKTSNTKKSTNAKKTAKK